MVSSYRDGGDQGRSQRQETLFNWMKLLLRYMYGTMEHENGTGDDERKVLQKLHQKELRSNKVTHAGLIRMLCDRDGIMGDLRLRDFVPRYLYTDRLTLELFNFSQEHYDCIIKCLNSALAYATLGDVGVREPKDFDHLGMRSRLQHPQLKDGIADQVFYYMVRIGSKDPHGELVGGVSIAQRRTTEDKLPPDIGWTMREEFGGRGYATEAATELLRFVREDLKIHDVICFYAERNERSNKVAAKLGFIPGGDVQSSNDPELKMHFLVLPGMEKIQIKGAIPLGRPDS